MIGCGTGNRETALHRVQPIHRDRRRPHVLRQSRAHNASEAGWPPKQIRIQADDDAGRPQIQLRAIRITQSQPRPFADMVVGQRFVLSPLGLRPLLQQSLTQSSQGGRTARLGQHGKPRPLPFLDPGKMALASPRQNCVPRCSDSPAASWTRFWLRSGSYSSRMAA